MPNKGELDDEGKEPQKLKEINGSKNIADRDRKNPDLEETSREKEQGDERTRKKEDRNQSEAK